MNAQDVQDTQVLVDQAVDQAKELLPKETTTNFNWLAIALIWAGVGFISGLLLKFAGRFLLWFFLIGIVAVFTFQYLGLVSINFEHLRNLIGIDFNLTLAQLFGLIFKWLQDHIVESIAWLVGFVVAYEFI